MMNSLSVTVLDVDRLQNAENLHSYVHMDVILLSEVEKVWFTFFVVEQLAKIGGCQCCM